MTETMPQLPAMIRSRTETLEHQLQQHAKHIPQVVVLGVGLDPKPVYHSDGHQTWFGIDLKPALRDREKRFCVPGCVADNFIPVAGDMREQHWVQDLRAAGFDPSQPSVVIMEGLSMYLTSDVISNVFKHIEEITSQGSILWVDHITSNALDMEAAGDFFAAMGRLGEPMVFGCTDLGQFAGNGWQVLQSVSAADILATDDRLFDAYRFTTLQRAQ
jgi:methyltransferase (TIGR00027 family)